jgi:hypothetical protein
MKKPEANPYTSKTEDIVSIALHAIDNSKTLEEATSKVKFRRHREMVERLWGRKQNNVFKVLKPESEYILDLDIEITTLQKEFTRLIMLETPFVITGFIAEENKLRQITLRKLSS